jgi:hypothetical protein
MGVRQPTVPEVPMAEAIPFPTPVAAGEPLLIDCDTCVLQATDACDDCIVTFLCGVDASVPVVVDLAEARALRELGDAGLAPPLRHRRGPVHRARSG